MNKKELELIEHFKDEMADVTTTLGNTLYKVSKDNNPEIEMDSPIVTKVKSLPEADRNILFETLEQVITLPRIKAAMSSQINLIGGA